MADVWQYDPVAANNQDPAPNGWPENLMLPSEVNDTGREMQAAQARELADINGTLTTGGFSDAYTLTLNRSSVTAYFNGLMVGFTAHESNAEQACTLNANGVGARPLIDHDGGAPRIIAGSVYQAAYDTARSSFQLLSPSRTPSVFYPPGVTVPDASGVYEFVPADIDGNLITVQLLGVSATFRINTAGFLPNGSRIRLFNPDFELGTVAIETAGAADQTIRVIDPGQSVAAPGVATLAARPAYTLFGVGGDIVVASVLM